MPLSNDFNPAPPMQPYASDAVTPPKSQPYASNAVAPPKSQPYASNAASPPKPSPKGPGYGNSAIAENGMAGNAAHTTPSPNMAQAQHIGPKPGRGGRDNSPIRQHPVVDQTTHTPVAHQYAPGAGINGHEVKGGGYTHLAGVAVNQDGSKIKPEPKDPTPAPAVS